MNAELTDEVVQGDDPFTGWYGFDTENDETGKVTVTALIHESGEKWVWKRAGEFVKWCDKQSGAKPIVICHNLEYDLVNEFGIDAYSEMSLNYLHGRLISARRGNVTFRDSFNHFRMSLMDIGEAIGIPKLEMDIYNETYVSQDAWICLKVMVGARDYIASLGGRIGATSGSSAMSVWKYMTDNEYCTGPIDTPWMRKGYYGGRTEIFQPLMIGRQQESYLVPELEFDDQLGREVSGEGYVYDAATNRLHLKGPGEMACHYAADIKGYDINSMYPFCMLNDFPEYIMEDPKMEKAKGMAEVTISVPPMFVAPLAHRGKSGELIYPVGVFRGVWTYDEIRIAQLKGAKVIKVHKAIGCNTLVRPFDQFINTLYQKRKVSTNESERLFLKVLMNSLYGKVASKNIVTRTVSRYNLMKALKEKRMKESRMAEVKWINYHRGLLDYHTPQQDYVNVVWGSMITAYARNLLTQYLWRVPEDKLGYCDTDSIYVNGHDLPTSKELGGLKLEKEASIMQCMQPKAYRLDNFWKAKGVPKPREKDNGHGVKITVNYAREYMEKGFTAFQAPIRFRASLGSRRGKANQWIEMKKSMKSGYNAKPLSDRRYVPPVLSDQMELFPSVNQKGTKKGK